MADRAAAIVSNKPHGLTPGRLYFCGAKGATLGFEGFAMTENARSLPSWRSSAGRVARSHWATQAAVLLPVVAVAGMAAWSMPSAPTNARGRTVGLAPRSGSPAEMAPARETAMLAARAAPQQAAPAEPAAVDGLKISSQSWRRGGLGSKALVTFTLRNDNAYAVKDIEIACSFTRQDGTHLTDRKRVIPEAVVNRKSRKTFSQLHIGFVNIYANKAKCAPVAASRV